VVNKTFEEDAYNFIYNATCMKEVRGSLLKLINQNRTGVVRPTAAIGAPARAASTAQYRDSLEKSYLFFKAQWTGLLGQSYAADVPWRTPGFVDLDEKSCKGRSYSASFATGGASLWEAPTAGVFDHDCVLSKVWEVE
jgi:hypothetical protein